MSEAEDLAARVAALEGEVHAWTNRSGPHPQELAEEGWKFLAEHEVLRDNSTRAKHEKGIETVCTAMSNACRFRREPLPSWYLEFNEAPPDYNIETGRWDNDLDDDDDDDFPGDDSDTPWDENEDDDEEEF